MRQPPPRKKWFLLFKVTKAFIIIQKEKRKEKVNFFFFFKQLIIEFKSQFKCPSLSLFNIETRKKNNVTVPKQQYILLWKQIHQMFQSDSNNHFILPGEKKQREKINLSMSLARFNPERHKQPFGKM